MLLNASVALANVELLIDNTASYSHDGPSELPVASKKAEFYQWSSYELSLLVPLFPLRTQLAGSSVSFISKFCPKHFFFDSALSTYTVRFLGVELVRLPGVPFSWRPLRLALRARKVAKN